MSVIECEYCQFESDNHKIMQYHQFLNHDIMSNITYNCMFCIFKTKNKKDFVFHLQFAHSKQKAKL